jgi:hypothetical protein
LKAFLGSKRRRPSALVVRSSSFWFWCFNFMFWDFRSATSCERHLNIKYLASSIMKTGNN